MESNEKWKWPYEVHYDRTNDIEIDILIIGGGHAGGMAGIVAAKRGMRVAVVDKAPIKRSGCGGAGTDHWNSVLDNPDSPMTTEENFSHMKNFEKLGHRDYIAMKGTWKTLLDLEEMGLEFRDKDGYFDGADTKDEKSKILKAYDYQDMISIKLCGGHYLKPVIYNNLKKEGVQLYERIMITRLLQDMKESGHPVTGAVGFSMETGEFFIFHAKSVVITTGYVCSNWIMNTELTGNSYRWDPNEIGEGMAMAWKAGAKVHRMHKNGNTKGAHPFAWPRFGVGYPYNTWFPCTIIDNNGKEVPWEDANGKLIMNARERNRPADGQPYIGSKMSDNLENISLPGLVHDLPDRIRNGEFELPLWADLSGMPEEERRSIWGVMVGNEGKSRYTLYDYYTRNGFNPEKHMLMAPIMKPQGYLSNGWFHGEPDSVKEWRTEAFGGQGEIAVDWDLMTSVEGLFCAGAASGLEGASFACSSGSYAGNRAAEYAHRHERRKEDPIQIEREHKRIYAPIQRQKAPEAYISWKELWAGSARVMQQCCGEFKTQSTLQLGLTWMNSIRENELQQTYARNPHELARVLEGETRITCSEIFLYGCLAEMEAKCENTEASKHIFVWKQGKNIEKEYKNPQYWLETPYEDTYLANYVKHKRNENEEYQNE